MASNNIHLQDCCVAEAVNMFKCPASPSFQKGFQCCSPLRVTWSQSICTPGLKTDQLYSMDNRSQNDGAEKFQCWLFLGWCLRYPGIGKGGHFPTAILEPPSPPPKGPTCPHLPFKVPLISPQQTSPATSIIRRGPGMPSAG
jgi:hypothetical protein